MLKNLLPVLLFCLFSLILSAQPVDNAAVFARKQVPVLCYHQIRDWRPSDKQVDKDYIIPPANFKAHIKMLSDSGYHTILPDELYDYLSKGTALPTKPVMLTFDDSDEDQYDIARPELEKYGFKGVYFITTIDLGKNKHYMDKKKVKQLSDEGNVIGCHTQDHSRADRYKHDVNPKKDDWMVQVEKPTQKLGLITGKKISCFAYPFGVWKKPVLPEIQKQGFKIAFQLTDIRDENYPLLTVRRLLDCGYWNTKTFNNNLTHSFLSKTRHPKPTVAAVGIKAEKTS